VARIFIVDDNPKLRAHLRGLLESVAEWEICGEAHDGKEAVEKHSSIRLHVTVMDFNMPELNGLHASRAILRNCPHSIADDFCVTQLAVQAKRHCRDRSRNDTCRASEG
jgi:DNA-binding NarL/FixJ family response regulator